MYNIKKIKFDANKTIALIFIIFIFSFAIGIGMKTIKSNIAPDNLKNNQLKVESTILNGIFNLVDNTVLDMEKKYADNDLLRSEFININGGIHRLMDKKIVEDVSKNSKVFKLDNNQLTFSYPEYDTDYCVENILELNKHLQQKNIDMLYIQAPSKINKYDVKLPKGVSDYTNENADKFLYGLKDHNIPFIDLRKVIEKENLDYDELFFNTDHHWKTETAFGAYKNVMEFLSENNNKSYDKKTTDMNNFVSTKYKKAFLGSLGKRVGKWYGGVDDYTLMYPNFDTSYNIKTLKKSSKIEEKNGKFENSIVIKNNIDITKPITTNRYASYFGADYPLIKITNNNVSDDKVLILQDSFGLPFSAFMSLNFNQTDILDLRHFKDKMLFEYIDENHYDMVLFLYNPSVFSEKRDKAQFIFN